MIDRESTAPEPAERVAELVLAVPGVAGLHAGQFGEVGTYLPGRRVVGVVIDENTCAINISVRYPGDLHTIAEHVRAAVTPVVDVPVDVTISDLATEATEEKELT